MLETVKTLSFAGYYGHFNKTCFKYPTIKYFDQLNRKLDLEQPIIYVEQLENYVMVTFRTLDAQC